MPRDSPDHSKLPEGRTSRDGIAAIASLAPETRGRRARAAALRIRGALAPARGLLAASRPAGTACGTVVQRYRYFRSPYSCTRVPLYVPVHL
eukprot:COSAG02_NODE_4842_length_4916_cov_2.448204_1_plen_92_part_00